jgi:hypothetical protein
VAGLGVAARTGVLVVATVFAATDVLEPGAWGAEVEAFAASAAAAVDGARVGVATPALGSPVFGGVCGSYGTAAGLLGVMRAIDGVTTAAGGVLTVVSATSAEWARAAGSTATTTMTAADARRRVSRLLTMLFNPLDRRNHSGSVPNIRRAAIVHSDS